MAPRVLAQGRGIRPKNRVTLVTIDDTPGTVTVRPSPPVCASHPASSPSTAGDNHDSGTEEEAPARLVAALCAALRHDADDLCDADGPLGEQDPTFAQAVLLPAVRALCQATGRGWRSLVAQPGAVAGMCVLLDAARRREHAGRRRTVTTLLARPQDARAVSLLCICGYPDLLEATSPAGQRQRPGLLRFVHFATAHGLLQGEGGGESGDEGGDEGGDESGDEQPPGRVAVGPAWEESPVSHRQAHRAFFLGARATHVAAAADAGLCLARAHAEAGGDGIVEFPPGHPRRRAAQIFDAAWRWQQAQPPTAEALFHGLTWLDAAPVPDVADCMSARLRRAIRDARRVEALCTWPGAEDDDGKGWLWAIGAACGVSGSCIDRLRLRNVFGLARLVDDFPADLARLGQGAGREVEGWRRCLVASLADAWLAHSVFGLAGECPSRDVASLLLVRARERRIAAQCGPLHVVYRGQLVVSLPFVGHPVLTPADARAAIACYELVDADNEDAHLLQALRERVPELRDRLPDARAEGGRQHAAGVAVRLDVLFDGWEVCEWQGGGEERGDVWVAVWK